MNILHICTYDKGGAANAALRLHRALVENGNNSKFLVLKKTRKEIPHLYEFDQRLVVLQRKYGFWNKFLWKMGIPQNEEQKLLKVIKKYKSRVEILTSPFSDCDLTRSELYKEADVIHLHWVSQFIDFDSFFKTNEKPIVWTLHDLNPLMGAFHYEEPFALESAELMRLEQRYYNVKKNAYTCVNNITLVAPSNWMLDMIQNSDAFPQNSGVRRIKYSLDRAFEYKDKSTAREWLGLDKEKFYILLVADSFDNPRKGMKIAKELIIQLKNEEINWLVVGESSDEFDFDNVHHLGYVSDVEKLANVYSSADCLFIPSRQDNLPNIVIEALLCGCPVIGFNVGGIPDMVQSDVNGMIVEDLEMASIVEKIRVIKENIEFYNRISIAKEAQTQFNETEIISKYIAIYQSMLG